MVPWKKSRLCNYCFDFFFITVFPFSDNKKHCYITGFSSSNPTWFPALAIQLYLLVLASATTPARQLPGVLLINKFLHLSSYKAESNESILDGFFFFFPLSLEEDVLRTTYSLQQMPKDLYISAGSLYSYKVC